MIYKNLLRINYEKIQKKAYQGWPGSLTPTYPRKPEEVLGWLSNQPLTLLCHSGMRVFHDYILNLEDQKQKPDTVLELSLSCPAGCLFGIWGDISILLLKKPYRTG